MTTPTNPTAEAPEVRVFHRPTGWTLPALSPDTQDCTANYTPDGTPCTHTAVWKLVDLHDLHATLSFWCDNDLPAEYRHLAVHPAA